MIVSNGFLVDTNVLVYVYDIWAVARLKQVPYVLTEDNEHGRYLEGVRFLDPFDPSFDLHFLAAS
ncbi:MAG: hypothetical protein HYY30_00060 [Chloroflexi bacterium]|nr:hypothetical protein [Chloroflexota bacterium]